MSQKPLLRALRGVRVDPPPIWLMRQAGRYLPEYRELRSRVTGFFEFCLTPALAVEATLQPLRRFDLDAAIVFSDILVVPKGLGVDVDFREGEGPILVPVRPADVAGLKLQGFCGRLAPLYETIVKVRDSLGPHQALIGFAGAPWTVACYMAEGGGSRDFTEVKRWLWRDAQSFRILIDILVEATVEHLAAQIAAGADCVQLFDSWAGVLPESEFRSYVIEPTAKVCAGLRARGVTVPVIGFARGATQFLAGYAAHSSVDAVGLDAMVTAAAVRELAKVKPLQGHLDPALLLAGGDAMRRRTDEILALHARSPHVFNLGHGVLPNTPIEHVTELVARVRNWRLR